MKNYIQQAIRSESPITPALTERLTEPATIRALHAILGMASELNEINQVLAAEEYEKLVDELGDVLWYLGLYLDSTGHTEFPVVDSSSLEAYTPEELVEFLSDGISFLADSYKKHIFYGKALTEHPISIAKIVLMSVQALCKLCDSSIEEIQEKNIAKLYARFPDKFSEDRAINRDLAKEEEVFSSQKE